MLYLSKDDPAIAGLVAREEERIETTINLIAAENHCPRSVLEVMGSVLNCKTIEGYPGHRFHAGCKFVDEVEQLAIERGKRLFNTEYVNVQPHSGTSANLAVYFSVLKTGDRILAMSLPHGGHLSHGHQASITSKCFNFAHYSVDPESHQIDYDQVRQMAHQFKPKMIVAGASSYPRLIDYAQIAAIAGEVSAFLLVDMAHIAGLVAAQAIPSPVPYSDFVTFTTYKTMMGGRGGVILAREEYKKKLNKAIFPGSQGTSAVNLIAAKALIFKLAAQPEYAVLQHKTIKYARLLAEQLSEKGYRLITGGTDNHQVVVDLAAKSISGSKAETTLEQAGIVLNRNVIPRDAETPGQVSGIRIGTAAIASRGMGESEVSVIANLIDQVLSAPDNRSLLEEVKKTVKSLCSRFPVYTAGSSPLS